MKSEHSTRRYSRPVVLLHWAGVGLMVMIVASGELRHLGVKTEWITMREAMVVHIGAAMAFLFLLIPRLLARIFGPRAPSQVAGSPFARFAAHAVHIALYIFVIGECLIGWAIVNAKGMRIPMPILGFEFPALVQEHERLVAWTVEAHMALGFVLYTAIALHVGAALWHHFVQRDGVLKRMSL